MQPGEERKLNSIKWKMTNKVAKDFISLFCGWSRSKKEMYQEQDEDGAGIVYVPTEESVLTQDKGFGDSMAKKALNGRGIFGRLKNALFAGGTDGSTITVAFQLDDPHNGWTIVEKKDVEGKEGKEGEEGKEGKEGKEGDSESSSSIGNGGSSSSLGGSSSGKGSGANGGSGGGKNGSGGSSTPFGLSPDSPMLAPIGAQEAQANPKDASGNLAARVKRLEDEVGITPPTSESSDPFYEDFMEERMELVKEVCDGKRDAYSLIEHCLLEE